MLEHVDTFPRRHIGPDSRETEEMLKVIGLSSLAELIDKTVPKTIRLNRPLNLPKAKGEHEVLEELRAIADKNQVFRSLIGCGYHDTITPGVVLRNIFLNPGWYTQYTPYQAEIAQGRLEALLNFQTMVADLTGLPVANASLLDEATAAAEAMHLMHAVATDSEGRALFVSDRCHPQTIAVVQIRAKPLGIEVVVADHRTFDPAAKKIFGAVIQYPGTDGGMHDDRAFIEKAHAAGAKVAVACDLLALCLLTSP